ncbi:MAG: Fructokinase [Chroococcopsis gigantea SAG 12.99]|jgi:fructokinase|nr:carbohydrate kinase [Chlorogloea purpurea SAG 13.99]MDV2998945.1 Fructokinase [Chroococcopsis gigantea SAG 12.99]
MTIICLGEILYDLIAEDLGTPLEEVVSWAAYPGGAPANVACGVVKLGTPSAFVGCVGKDRVGRELTDLLNNIGVNTAGLAYHPTAPTRQVYVTRSYTGERHFAGFGEIATEDFADTQPDYQNIPETLFDGAQYLVTGTLGLAYPASRQAIYHALNLSRDHGVRVFIDINWRPVFWTDIEAATPLILHLLSQAHVIKCSEEEAQWLFGSDQPTHIQDTLKSVRAIIVTRGEKGCSYAFDNIAGDVPSFKVESVDTTGAGDGFVAGFLHKCCEWGDRVFTDRETAGKALIYANAVGAIVTTAPGAIDPLPNPAQVETFLEKHKHNQR